MMRSDGWDIALATGGWRPSARLKLKASGLDVPDMVLTCANDAVTREEIVRLARERAAAIRGDSYDRVVSIGDGVWDVRTAANLELPFIGIATGEREAKLRAAGASVVLSDFQDLIAFRSALVIATAP
jgi:phosphoglycolate phosphatase-like HAD superfamily hydrolase